MRSEVSAALNEIDRRLFAGAPRLGVHFRGTDKRNEADRVPPERVLAAIDAELARLPSHARLFVATDEHSFLAACVARFGSRAVALDDHRRSKDGQPVHRQSDGNGYALARDALFNCLMLSRCTRVIKTASILSSWSKVFEPALNIYTLSRRSPEHAYFPERDIPDYLF